MSRCATAPATVSATLMAVVTVLSVSVAAPLFAAAPAQAREQARGTVDARTGPVAFANVASLAVLDDGTGERGGSVISETQRSPLRPGTSRLGDDRTALPGSAGERAATGPNHLLRIDARDVSATLERTHVPTATAIADFTLVEVGTDTTVLDFEAATSTVRCPSPDAVSARTSGGRLSLLDRNGELTPVALPDGGEAVRRENLPFGPSIEIGEDEHAVSDVTVRAVSSFDQLLRQDEWRGGDVTAVAGWLVRIDTRITRAAAAARSETGDGSTRTAEPDGAVPGEASGDSPGESPGEEGTGPGIPGAVRTGTPGPDGEPRVEPRTRAAGEGTGESRSRTVRTRLVLGGVSCSVPGDFEARTGIGGGDGDPTPSVPVRIPAGAPAPGVRDGGRAEAPASATTVPSAGTGWGLGLLGGGAVLGVAAVLLARRPRHPARSRAPEQR